LANLSRLRTRTLRARVASAAGAAILAAIALFAAATVLVVRHELRGSLDQALRERAQQVAELAVSAPAVLTSPGALESPVSGRQIAVEVIDARGRILARSLTLGARLLPQDRVSVQARLHGRAQYEDITLASRHFRLYAAPIALAGGPAAGGAVLVASDTTDIASTTHHLAILISVIGAGVALLAALFAGALTRRGLVPLRRLADAAGEIERTADPARRLPEPAVADEIAQLTGVLNRMLSSLQAARETERRFLADASHELRTPVTTLLGNVEYAARHGADEELISELRADAARLARLVDDLLVLERAGATERPGSTVELSDLASAITRERDGRVRLGEIEPVRVLGDADALRRAVENLIENGLLHGPPAGVVTIRIKRVGGVALLSVSDEGPGPDSAERGRLFERFWRGTGASERPGSGLGLAIVAAIAQRHGGLVKVDGSTFTLELPAA
jgi:two-component system sensor histidine kinase MprB